MSSTNKTTYYELPQFISTDIPTWLGDVNGAMSAIDTALKSNADRADLASAAAGQAVNTANATADAVSAVETSVAGLSTRVTACENTNASQSTQISGLGTSVSGLDDRVTALEQSSGGGHTYNIGVVSLGSYNGSGLSNSATLTGAVSTSTLESIDSTKIVGVVVLLEFGNGYARTFIGANELGGYLGNNLFNVSLHAVPRGYTNSGCTVHNINLSLGSVSANGSRSVSYVSDVATTYQLGSSTSGSASSTNAYYNTNGIVNNPSVTLSCFGIYLAEN